MNLANISQGGIMIHYNMLDAKNNLSKICKLLVDGKEDSIVICSNGKPLVKVVPYKNNSKRKAGILEKKYKYDKYFETCDKEIAKLFYEGKL